MNIPASTQWTLDAAGPTGRAAIDSVFMIICPSTGSKGSGFLIDSGLVITNEHVVRGCTANQVILASAYGQQYQVTQQWIDPDRDIAVLKPTNTLGSGLALADTKNLDVGTAVTTWGYPLGYNGPAPLLSVGYLAGFSSYQTAHGTKKHLVVNGAFNSGNSGGALFRTSDNKVIGIVASKHAPISQFHQSAIQALASNRTGVCFSGTDSNGVKVDFVESQIVADILIHFRSLTQVMIGEAIAVEELADMLKEHGVA